MSNLEDRSDIILDGATANWTLNKEALVQGTYVGTFKFRCFLTPTQKIAAGREQRELLGSNAAMAEENEVYLAFALTQLKYRIIQAPPFWSSMVQESLYQGDLPDEDIISEVLNAAIASELKYKNSLRKRKEEALNKAKKYAEQMLKQREENASKNKESDDNS